MVACAINSAEGQLQSGMRSGCNGEYTCWRGSFRIDSLAAEVELSSTGGGFVVGTESSKFFQIGHDCFHPSS